MPRNLDDFELERTPYTPPDEPDLRTRPADETEVEPSPAPEPPRGGRLFPLILVVLALIAFGVLGTLYFVFRAPRKAASRTTPPPTAAPAATPVPSAVPVETGPLPALDESDAYVRDAAAGLSTSPELARWLAQPGLVRTLTVVVLNVADGETPRPHLGFLAPRQRFRAKAGPGGRTVPDPAGFAGYDRFADTVSSIDAAAAVATYRRLEPLFEAAYRELGHPRGGFRDAIERGSSALLAAPVPPADAELLPHAIGFRYADPRFEGLTAAQKQFLRMGPRNVALVQAKLRELRAALGSAQPPPSDRTH